MTCPTPETLSRFHDDDLPIAEADAVRAHLPACDPCQAELAQYRRFSLAFASAPAVPLSATARQRMTDAMFLPVWVRLMLPLARPFAAAALLLISLGLPVLAFVEPGNAATTTTSSTPPTATASTGATAALASRPWESANVTLADAETLRVVPQSQFADWVVADLASARPIRP